MILENLLPGLLLGVLLGALATALFFQQRLRQSRENEARLTAEMEAGKRLLAILDAQERSGGQQQMIAAKALEETLNRAENTRLSQLDSLLAPLRERIGEFERTVRDVYSTEARERFHLQKEVERLSQASLRVGDDARSLAEALRGNSKIRGNWGESTLLRLLEASGLRQDTDYRLQASFQTPDHPDQTRLIPDVLILLPEDKHLVIDAKVSLIAYERYLQADTDALRQQALREHADAVQRHVKDLSSKHYQQLQGLNSPDLVLLFMPIEDALILALQTRPELMAFAWEKKVVPVSATSLFATLQTVASVWRLAQQSRNAQEIARQGGVLYDKFADFVASLDKLGKSLATASQVYDETLNRLRDGRESLMKHAHKLREMGAPATKRLPEGE